MTPTKDYKCPPKSKGRPPKSRAAPPNFSCAIWRHLRLQTRCTCHCCLELCQDLVGLRDIPSCLSEALLLAWKISPALQLIKMWIGHAALAKSGPWPIASKNNIGKGNILPCLANTCVAACIACRTNTADGHLRVQKSIPEHAHNSRKLYQHGPLLPCFPCRIAIRDSACRIRWGLWWMGMAIPPRARSHSPPRVDMHVAGLGGNTGEWGEQPNL